VSLSVPEVHGLGYSTRGKTPRLRCYTDDRTSFIFAACCFDGKVVRNDHLRSSGRSSLPQFSSISACSFNCFMPMLQSIAAIEMPSTTCQTTFSAMPKVFRTSSFNGWFSDGIIGIVANAISTPCGNCVRKVAGNFFFSSF